MDDLKTVPTNSTNNTAIPSTGGGGVVSVNPEPALGENPATAPAVDLASEQISVVPVDPPLGSAPYPAPASLPTETPTPAPVTNPEQELNIPPEIAAAKLKAQHADNGQSQAVGNPTAKKPFPLKIVIIAVTAVVVIVGGYFAYNYFTGGSTNTTSQDQIFISE